MERSKGSSASYATGSSAWSTRSRSRSRCSRSRSASHSRRRPRPGRSGIAAPFAYLIAGVGSLCLASVIIRFTRRMASAGGLYTYISRGLNPSAGFLGGWLYGGALRRRDLVRARDRLVLHVGGDDRAHEPALGLVHVVLHLRCAALALLAFLDIRISTRIQLVAAAVGVGAILAARGRDRVQGRRLGLHVRAAQPGERDVDEQPVPRRRAGVHRLHRLRGRSRARRGERATRCARSRRRSSPPCSSALVYYVFVTWMMGVGFGAGNAAAWAKDPAALDTLATRYVGNWLAVIIDFSVAASGFIAALGGLHLTSRTLFAMGREGGLPRVFAWTHPRFRTPWAGIAFSLVVTLAARRASSRTTTTRSRTSSGWRRARRSGS